MTVSKRFKISTQTFWNLMKITTSWVDYVAGISDWLGQNWWYSSNSHFFGQSIFYYTYSTLQKEKYTPLPSGIEELCWPDALTWEPHLQGKTKTYTLVLTDFRGQRTFGYCRRIQAEGDNVCLPLAICILTRHGGARG